MMLKYQVRFLGEVKNLTDKPEEEITTKLVATPAPYPTILQESPWYQQLTAESEQRTQRNERLSFIRMGLEAKFGADGLELMQQINEISDSDRLTEILRCIITAQTLEEVHQVL
jgi:predicted transposase YdaD